GTYRLSIRPLIEGAQWMEDYGVFWYVTVAGTAPVGALAPLPAKWPRRVLDIGMTDPSAGAAALRASAPFAFRYEYLAGGVNTGKGWTTWGQAGSNGGYVTDYVSDSARNATTPVFSYYQLLQSSPGNALAEPDSDFANLANASTMSAYYADLKTFFQRAGAASGTVVVFHFEPDLLGFVQQRYGDDATGAPAVVSATGMPELAGLPDNAAGLAQAVVRLRDAYAPNVILAYHLSLWGTKRRGVNNTLVHYQDNKVEWLFDEPGRANLSAYVRSGVIAFLFGKALDGNTCACDAAHDGVTNPPPISGNTRDSLSADDDGG